ncbi:hypothetical protein U1Q18_048502 [Sarracenia purpurea var. burkii]
MEKRKNSRFENANCRHAEVEMGKQLSDMNFSGILDLRDELGKFLFSLNKKLKSYIFQFSYLQNLLPTEVKRILYYGLVESTIRYGIQVWGSAVPSKIKKVEKTQRYILEELLPYSIVRTLQSEKDIFSRTGILSISMLHKYCIVSNVEEEVSRSDRQYVVPLANNRHGE